jgi:DnaD/phage-associated family protein
MGDFEGFSAEQPGMIRIPEEFFTSVLPEIDELAELKVTLYLIWQISMQDGPLRYLRLSGMESDEALLASLSANPGEARQHLFHGLGLAIARRTLLCTSPPGDDEARLYFLNTPRSRAAVEALGRGEWLPEVESGLPVELTEKGNIYQLYEANIGPLTPMIAETLRDAEDAYPNAWIEEALQIAVAKNVRNWRYIAAILERWQNEGKDERKDRQDPQEDRRRYIEGEYSDYIEH